MPDYICKTLIAVEFDYVIIEYDSFHLMVRTTPLTKTRIRGEKKRSSG